MFGFGNHPDDDNEYDHEDDHDHGEQQDEEVDNQQYYKILNVENQAALETITQAFEKLLKIQQQKTQKDEEKIKKLNQAYDVLKNQQKRQIYDRFGKAGLQEGENDLFSMLMGGGKNNSSKQPKMQATKKALPATLQTLYKGQKIEVPHTRARKCEKCNGKGGQNVKQCQACKGRGAIVQMYQVAPGMYQQVQKKCQKCQGQGQFIGEGGKCDKCQGKKILQNQKIIQVNILKGTPDNFPIKFEGQGNQVPGALPGDLYFFVQQKPHEKFTRVGADLSIKQTISLAQALTGFQFQLKHLDDKLYTIKSDEGQIIEDGMKKIVKGLGMPFFKKQEQYGNLIVQFHVAMPKNNQISKQQIRQLVALLPGQVNKRPEGEYQMFQDFDPDNLNTNEQGGKLPEDQYDPQDGSSPVICGHQ